jgi:hypothetical protein
LYGDVTVIMDKCCLISFFMGKKYFDSSWCDVVSMNTYHILLGR